MTTNSWYKISTLIFIWLLFFGSANSTTWRDSNRIIELNRAEWCNSKDRNSKRDLGEVTMFYPHTWYIKRTVEKDCWGLHKDKWQIKWGVMKSSDSSQRADKLYQMILQASWESWDDETNSHNERGARSSIVEEIVSNKWLMNTKTIIDTAIKSEKWPVHNAGSDQPSEEPTLDRVNILYVGDKSYNKDDKELIEDFFNWSHSIVGTPYLLWWKTEDSIDCSWLLSVFASKRWVRDNSFTLNSLNSTTLSYLWRDKPLTELLRWDIMYWRKVWWGVNHISVVVENNYPSIKIIDASYSRWVSKRIVTIEDGKIDAWEGYIYKISWHTNPLVETARKFGYGETVISNSRWDSTYSDIWFTDRASKFWVSYDVASGMQQVAQKMWFRPEYLLAIWLSENARNPDAVWDNWCSFWSFQMNACAWRWRWWEVHYGMQFKTCALDSYCSSKRTADRFKNVYWCNIESDWTITNAVTCLSKHQWARPASWYIAKTDKNLWLVWVHEF